MSPTYLFYDRLFLAGHAGIYYFSELVTFREMVMVGFMNVRRFFYRPRQ